MKTGLAANAVSREHPWTEIHRIINVKTGRAQIFASFAGAGVCYSYFALFDSSAPVSLITRGFLITVAMFAGLVAFGYMLNRRWERGLIQFVDAKIVGSSISETLEIEARRKILNLPFMAALVALINWAMASLIMSGYNFIETVQVESLTTASFQALRVFAGVIISGIITSAIVFFVVEIHTRKAWPHFFPRGDLTKTEGALQMKLRTRMFIAFLLASIVPMILMAILSYNKARLMLVMNPEDVLQSLFHLTVFLLIAALAVAVILSVLVSSSIIAPVREMERAMVKVRKGDLATSAQVAANDELGVLAESFDQMIEGLRDRERIKETFGRFVTPEIAQAILEHQPVLGGENTEVSILFSDVRNYTAICEQLSPKEVISLLNDYFSYMVRAIEQHHGLVYQFVGDGIMAVFGAPVKLADHADSSVQSGLAMMDALDRFNAEVRAGLPPIRIGIGINTGPVVAGIIGTEQRMEYRVVGDSVNLAARIEALNKEFHTDVLISRATVDQLKERFPLKPFEPVKVKGKEDYVQVYAVTR
ncbi:MAG: adenylate/guanylate cyclase domain-containing protein [Deltaproteobacteria bacterium]|nr:adenylate/guanylate cyclase domain-containing protein [Deltaproteobacteria bacterium]